MGQPVDEKKVLNVPAYVDIAEADKSQWVARVLPSGSPLDGLFAFGADFPGARRGLAAVVWNAVAGGAAGISAEGVEAVRVLATTRKTFSVAELATETP